MSIKRVIKELRRAYTTEDQKKYLDFIRNLLKDKAYVALAYMTGIVSGLSGRF